MTPLIKLGVGVAGTALIANLAYSLVRSPLLSDLGSRSAHVMAANGITDGRANWTTDNGWTWRVARLSGTADPATRRRTRDAVAALAGVSGAVWDDAPTDEMPIETATAGASATSSIAIAACQAQVDAITTDHPIDFEPHNATPDPAARQLLDAVAQVLATCPGAHVAITDHTGTAGAAAINMALSQARADAVARALVDRGIPAQRLSATGKGSAEPIDFGTDAVAEAHNRRVGFRLSAQGRPR